MTTPKFKNLRAAFSVAQDSVSEWMADGAFRLSAALAYYTAFSLGPLLMVSTGVAGLIYGKDAVHGALTAQLSSLVGQAAAEAINAFLADSSNTKTSGLTTLVGGLVLILGATTFFLELKSALNLIWKVPADKSSGVFRLFMQRLLSVAMVLSTGFLLLVSLVISTALAAVSKYIEAVSGIPSAVFGLVDVVSSIVFIALVFSLIFKLLPDTVVRWPHAVRGAILTSVLFTIGKALIGWYLGQSAFSSTYGASASVMVILIWTYYSTLILFLGAEVTKTLQKRAEQGVHWKSTRS